jgi:hypothetical protein
MSPGIRFVSTLRFESQLAGGLSGHFFESKLMKGDCELIFETISRTAVASPSSVYGQVIRHDVLLMLFLAPMEPLGRD